MSDFMRNTFSLAVVLLAFAVLALMWQDAQEAEGSIDQGQEYYSTTTYAADPFPERRLKIGYGSLGSVVITGAGTGLTSIYDATTTNAAMRAPTKATSSILIAQFPVSAPAGTYTFDASFSDGLLIVSSGLEATSTITWR